MKNYSTTQRSILLGTKQKTTGITADGKWSSKGVMKILGSVYNPLSHRGDFASKHQTEPNFETVYQVLVTWERVSNVLELLHDSPDAGHFWD